MKLSRTYKMNTLNRQVFAIVNADNTKILTEIGWVGLFLSQEAMTPDQVTEKLYGGVSLKDGDWIFEQHADSTDYIQYYKTFNRAAEVLLKVSTRENNPITELMSIVTIDVNATATVTTMFDYKEVSELHRRTLQLEQFEKDAAQKLNCKPNAIMQYRLPDLSGYSYPAFHRSYEAWENFNACLIQE